MIWCMWAKKWRQFPQSAGRVNIDFRPLAEPNLSIATKSCLKIFFDLIQSGIAVEKFIAEPGANQEESYKCEEAERAWPDQVTRQTSN